MNNSISRSVPHGIRGCLIDCVKDPFFYNTDQSVRWFIDGLLVIRSGRIIACGDYEKTIQNFPNLLVTDYSDRLITPGFIDIHVHYPQTAIVASYGKQLLEWLEKYTFPEERKFQNIDYAAQIADIFLNELLRNGTTTAMVWSAVFPESVQALFQAAKQRNLRLITGKVMMDRNAPDYTLAGSRLYFTKG